MLLETYYDRNGKKTKIRPSLSTYRYLVLLICTSTTIVSKNVALFVCLFVMIRFKIYNMISHTSGGV